MTSDNDPVDPATFLITGPLWAAAQVGTENKPLGGGLGLMCFDSKKGRCVPLFTDKDLADKACKNEMRGEALAVRIATPGAYVQFLEALKGLGFGAVAFDPSGSARTLAIDRVLEEAKRQIGQRGEHE